MIKIIVDNLPKKGTDCPFYMLPILQSNKTLLGNCQLKCNRKYDWNGYPFGLNLYTCELCKGNKYPYLHLYQQ